MRRVGGKRARRGERGGESMKGEVRQALISPWPPSLGFLHSGGTDEMKSNGERERGDSERWGRTLNLTLNSLVCQPLL